MCFDEESRHITAMKSLEGEVVPFKNKVLLSNNVEVSSPSPWSELYEIRIYSLSLQNMFCLMKSQKLWY